MSSEMIPSLSVLILVSVAMAHDYNSNLTLHFSEREYVLLTAWKTGSFLGMFGSTLIVFLICIVHEALEGLRYFLAREHMLGSPEMETVSQSSVKPLSDLTFWELPRKIRNSFTGYRVTQALLYGVQTLIGYLLILIVVSFNVWLILAVVLGKAAGYFMFTGSPSVEKATQLTGHAVGMNSYCVGILYPKFAATISRTITLFSVVTNNQANRVNIHTRSMGLELSEK